MDRCKLEADIAVIAAKLEESLDSTEEVLDHGLSLFDEVEAYLTHSVYDSSSECKPDANIVVLGTTGTGKSTVVSFLFGKGRMLVHHESPFSHVLVSEVPLPGVAIRSGSDSTTLLPICNHVRLGEEVIAAWDMPGSRDTRGPFVELLVHFIFKWMMVGDKTLRFIIVSPPLHERPQIASLQNTINGSLIRAENAVLVYTKCSWDFDPDSTADLKIKESKRGIRSFALPAPVKLDAEGHDYTAQYQEEKCEILTALAELRSDSVKFEDPLPEAAQRLLERKSRRGFSKLEQTIENFVTKRKRFVPSVGTIPVVLLVGFASLAVDSALVMWANVALVSPCVRVTLPKPFNLSAVGQAGSLSGYNSFRGEDGKHGLPGLPGGNLFVVFRNLEDATKKLRATVSCGQRGGNAQNGGDGVNGGDSVYSLKDFENEVNCATKNGLLEKEEETIDELQITSYKSRISPLAGRFYGAQGLKEWSLVKESKSGACGTRPGSGGIGGFGGKGGSLRIHENAEVWEGTGAMGEQGDDGVPGKPSRDGRASPTFSAVVYLWYFERGWYHGTMSDPEVSLGPPTPIATPPLMYAAPATGAGAIPVENFSLGLQYVKANSRLCASIWKTSSASATSATSSLCGIMQTSKGV
ncbi:hypothetical protein PF005_g13642 [Phytophthora fragariae]|uniref:Uncharacterized protein n=2 Tax=Phytophthora fragariae TaxID=53985 RepID=A0A6A3KIJ0_9STRA|nr:hypothetical protein PF009_g14837 [Phytophthora fragariae]KAE9004715.1 hypothetical protein PF011_g12344 [Phytophthora fragariae]KAE9204853.1 hypothetical protein PF005_g13642 [Phytophthora fragariae]